MNSFPGLSCWLWNVTFSHKAESTFSFSKLSASTYWTIIWLAASKKAFKDLKKGSLTTTPLEKKNCCSYFRIDVSCVNYYTNQYRDAYRYAQRQNHDTQVVNSLWFCCCYTSLQSPSCINTLTAQRRYQQATKFSVIFIGSEHMVYRRPKVGIIAWFVYYVTCFCQTVWQKDSDVLLLVRFAKTYPQNLTCQWYILIQFCPRASFPEGLSWLK